MRCSMLINNFYYKNNRLQQLKGFYYTILKGSVVKAAEELGLTQSTVSSQISSLERDLGVKLFDRRGRNLEPNDNGMMLYSMSVESIQRLDSVFEEFISKRQNSTASIDICANQVSILYLLPDLIKKYRNHFPGVNLMIRNIAREDGMNKLYNNETDLCLYPYLDTPVECDFYHLADYDPILLLRRDHPLANKADLRLEEVAEYDLIRIDPHLITLPLFEEVIRNYKLGSNIKLECGDWEILKKLVKADIGVAIISNICLDDSDNDLVGIKLPKYFPKMSYGYCVKRGKILSPHVRDFININN